MIFPPANVEFWTYLKRYGDIYDALVDQGVDPLNAELQARHLATKEVYGEEQTGQTTGQSSTENPKLIQQN